MSKVSRNAAGKHRRCDFANGACELGKRARQKARVNWGMARGEWRV